MKRNWSAILTGAALLVFGFCLEVFYYRARFHAEGDGTLLAIGKGVALTLLLVAAVAKMRNKKLLLLIVPLVCFSIFCTSSGQATTYADRYNAKQSERLTTEKAATETEERKAALSLDLSELKAAKARKEAERDAVPLASRSVWQFIGKDSDGDPQYQKVESTVFQTINKEIQSFQTEIEAKETELSEIGTVAVSVREKESDPYYIISGFTRINVNVVQYLMQMAFSLFSALLAPFGVYLLAPERRASEEKKAPTEWRRLVEFWVSWSWYSHRNKGSEKILPEKVFLQYAETHEKAMTKEIYDQIKKTAIIQKVIDADDMILYNDEKEAIEAILKKFERGVLWKFIPR